MTKEEDLTHVISAARKANGTVEGLKASDLLWIQCVERVQGYARKLCKRVGLQHLPDTDHDVAMSVLGSVIGGLQQGRWLGLDDTVSLWKMLYTVTRRKCYRAIGKELKGKPLVAETEDAEPIDAVDFADQSETLLRELLDLLGPASDDWLTKDETAGLLLGEARSPLLEQVADRAVRQLANQPNEEGRPGTDAAYSSPRSSQEKRTEQLRQIALLKILGYTNDQIKAITGVPKRTIDLRLRIVREKWGKAMDP